MSWDLSCAFRDVQDEDAAGGRKMWTLILLTEEGVKAYSLLTKDGERENRKDRSRQRGGAQLLLLQANCVISLLITLGWCPKHHI